MQSEIQAIDSILKALNTGGYSMSSMDTLPQLTGGTNNTVRCTYMCMYVGFVYMCMYISGFLSGGGDQGMFPPKKTCFPPPPKLYGKIMSNYTGIALALITLQVRMVYGC